MVLETERLYARVWQVEDAPNAFRMYGDPEVTRYIGGTAEPDLAAMRERLSWIIERNQKWGDRYGSWPIFDKQNDELVGTTLLKPIPDANNEDSADIEIGWHLVRDQWGKGYATEMGVAQAQRAFSTVNLQRIIAVVDPPNLASQRVAKRLGMTHLGRSTSYYGGREVELYELLR